MDLQKFQAIHPNVNLSQVYLNFTIHERTNITLLLLQGDTPKKARGIDPNISLENMTSYPVLSGSSFYVVAYPTNLSAFIQHNFTFSFVLYSP